MALTGALARKSAEGKGFAFPGQTYSARCVNGAPSAVERSRVAALTKFGDQTDDVASHDTPAQERQLRILASARRRR